jgi:hypothetical protein
MELDDFMSAPLTTVTMPGQIQFERARTGIPGWRSDKSEKIGDYEGRVYNVKNINLSLKKRTEHLTEEEVKADQEALQVMENGEALEAKLKQNLEENEKAEAEKSETESKDDDKQETVKPKPHRQSLPPPEKPESSAEQYFGSGNVAIASGNEAQMNSGIVTKEALASYVHLGRPMKIVEENKKYTATAWMADSFPLALDTVIGILEMLAPQHRHIEKLKSFIQNNLPPGFPVKIEIPVFPTVTAQVTFMDYSAQPVDSSLFQVPKDYNEDAQHFEQGGHKVAAPTEEQ